MWIFFHNDLINLDKVLLITTGKYEDTGKYTIRFWFGPGEEEYFEYEYDEEKEYYEAIQYLCQTLSCQQ